MHKSFIQASGHHTPLAAGHALAAQHPSYGERLALSHYQQLLANQGLSVDLARLQSDPCYAQRSLGQAIQSACPELHAQARRLSASFILDA